MKKAKWKNIKVALGMQPGGLKTQGMPSACPGLWITRAITISGRIAKSEYVVTHRATGLRVTEILSLPEVRKIATAFRDCGYDFTFKTVATHIRRWSKLPNEKRVEIHHRIRREQGL